MTERIEPGKVNKQIYVKYILLFFITFCHLSFVITVVSVVLKLKYYRTNLCTFLKFISYFFNFSLELVAKGPRRRGKSAAKLSIPTAKSTGKIG